MHNLLLAINGANEPIYAHSFASWSLPVSQSKGLDIDPGLIGIA